VPVSCTRDADERTGGVRVSASQGDLSPLSPLCARKSHVRTNGLDRNSCKALFREYLLELHTNGTGGLLTGSARGWPESWSCKRESECSPSSPAHQQPATQKQSITAANRFHNNQRATS